MAETTGKIKRHWMVHYVDAAEPGSTTPNYVRLGDDLEELSVEMNANIETTRNILGGVSTRLDSYEPQASVEPYYAEVGNPLYTRLQKIYDERLTLDDVKTTVVEVHLWEEGTSTGTYVAYREDAIIEISSYGGDPTGLQIPFNIHYIGNRVKGTFNVSTKTFTPDA